jgi:hypothetical protein
MMGELAVGVAFAGAFDVDFAEVDFAWRVVALL